MKPFVRLLVAGGIVLVVGLWLAMGVATWTAPWLLGVALTVFGSSGLAVGLKTSLDGPV